MSKDHSLDALLEQHGCLYEVGDGYWVKIVATKVRPGDGKPHGIEYSLTLHAPSGARVLGYDNAHAVRAGSGPAGKRAAHDHRHAGSAVRHYAYTDAGRLMDDFWRDVERFLKKEGVI